MTLPAITLGETYTSNSVEETMDWAQQFAAVLKEGDVVVLHGNLGAGKTHFVKGVCAYFGIDPEQVQSPTFTLVHEYKSTRFTVYHFDCYRLKNMAEAMEIGMEEYLYDEGICLIEWPENIEAMLPSHTFHVHLNHAGAAQRELRITR